ncbi:MAG: GTPase ObgE [Gemmatimonadales bacterium]
MSFVDRVVVEVQGGGGGDGASSFARFKFKAKGGPDGGDGGNGGSVYVRAESNLATLLDYRYRTSWKAERGGHGKGKNMTGASRDDVIMPVPPGTLILDEATGETLGEVMRPGDQVLVAKGGRGGRGNARFTSATHQAPREWEEGTPGEEKRLAFVLKLIADVGLVGEPNAGKSTLLSVISAARPKIADYPFTTLEPNLGVVGLSGSRSFVVADIPGIIEGAHAGKGLGLKFLQHVERTRLLAFLVPLDSPDPQAVLDQLRREVALYSEVLATKPYLVILSKGDLLPEGDELPTLDAPDARMVVTISSVSGHGLEPLKESLWSAVQEVRAEDAEEEPWSPSDEDDAAAAADIPDPFTDEFDASDDE